MSFFVCYPFIYLGSDNVDGGDVPGIAHIMNSVSPDTNGICQTDVLVMSNTSRTGTVCLTISDDRQDEQKSCLEISNPFVSLSYSPW